MKKFLWMIVFCAFVQCLRSQTDSVIQYKMMEGELHSKSNQDVNKRYYDYLPITMDKGDRVVVYFESKEFVTALFILDSANNPKFSKADNPLFFSTIGSSLQVPYVANEIGKINIVFSTAKPNTTGKFKVHIYYYNNRFNTITNNSSFCDKLKFIANNANTNFEFVKDFNKNEKAFGQMSPTIKISPEANNVITTLGGGIYKVYNNSTKSADSATRQFNQLEQALTKCLIGTEKKIEEKEKQHESFKKSFVRGVIFTMPGNGTKNLNSLSNGKNYKYELNLKLEQNINESGQITYSVKLSVW